MKAIVLAAGSGSRLRPLTDDRPKCMVSYRGTPIIDHLLGCLSEVGVSDVVVVGGYKIDVLRRHLGQKVRIVENSRYESSNMVTSLFTASGEFNDDILIVYGDIVVTPRSLSPLVSSSEPAAILINTRWRNLWQMRMENPLADAETLKLDSSGNVIELGRKPKSYEEIEGQYMGLIKFSAATLNTISKWYADLDRTAQYEGKSFDGMFMTTFLQHLIDKGLPIRAIPVPGGWVEVDSPGDLDSPMEY